MTARLAILPDFLEEGWPSMDLVSEMLLAQPSPFETARVCPVFRRRFLRLPIPGRLALNADRLLNRMVYYPRYLRGQRAQFDLFHVCDHSYGQLVHELSGAVTGVFCHDLDTFRCLLEPEREPRPVWFRAMARRSLKGVQKAAIVFHSTDMVRQQLLKHGLVDPGRLVQAPYGVSEEFHAGGEETVFTELPGGRTDLAGCRYLLHVGSCIARKRIDILLETFANLQRRYPELRLVKVGGPWTSAQQESIERLSIGSSIVVFMNQTREAIATLYRGAAAVLVPSEAEGFGLPVIEALACGAVVIASDIPVLREVAEEAALYCGVGDVSGWVETVGQVLERPASAPSRAIRLERARRYTWANHAQTVFAAYQRILGVTRSGV